MSFVNYEYNTLIEKISGKLNRRSGYKFILAFVFSILCILFGIWGIYSTLTQGLTVWGINQQVTWGIAIVNFVFWIGIGHAGTLISAILYLLNQKWRWSLHRSAEAMTIIAVIVAAMFPVIHTGRPWLNYWLFPYPSQMSLWGNFKSPLMWDVFAILTYLIVSVIFWYVGLIPDLSILKSRIKSKRLSEIYFFFSLGWKGLKKQWQAHNALYRILAGIATPLVISVHSIVSFDFSAALLPGWHSTIFPPYFVAGAIFSGCAMVIIIMVIARELLDLKDFISAVQLENISKIMLTFSLLIGYVYLTEIFFAFYSQNKWEAMQIHHRIAGGFALPFLTVIILNFIIPQMLWFKKVRGNIIFLILISVCVCAGMWLERYIIVISSLSFDYLKTTFSDYIPSLTDISLTIGSFGLFSVFFLIFVRFIPVVSIFELHNLNSGKSMK